MRQHGLESPHNPMQITTWFILPLLISQFIMFQTCVLISPTTPNASVAIILTLMHLVSAAFIAYYAYVATRTDSMDPHLRRFLSRSHDHTLCTREPKYTVVGGRLFPPIHKDDSYPNEDELTSPPNLKFCWVCQTSVDTKSMHCKFCDKCVSHFDHHCQWLNTCIGEYNYPYFFRVVASTFFYVIFNVLVGGGNLIGYFVPGSKLLVTADTLWGRENMKIVWLAFTIFFVVLNLACASLVGQLLVFHMQLIKKEMSTYEYIVQDNTKKREAKLDKKEQSSNNNDGKERNGNDDQFEENVTRPDIQHQSLPMIKKDDVREEENNESNENTTSNHRQEEESAVTEVTYPKTAVSHKQLDTFDVSMENYAGAKNRTSLSESTPENRPDIEEQIPPLASTKARGSMITDQHSSRSTLPPRAELNGKSNSTTEGTNNEDFCLQKGSSRNLL